MALAPSRIRTFLSAALAASLVATLAVAPVAASADVLDQQSVVGSGETIAATMAQTFTAGITGDLTRVEAALSNMQGTAYDGTVEIRTVDGVGKPTSTVLASTTLPAASIPSATAWVDVTFAAPATVTAGTQYALVVIGPTYFDTYEWGLDYDNTYAGGHTWHYHGETFHDEYSDRFDYKFRTYVHAAHPTVEGLIASIRDEITVEMTASDFRNGGAPKAVLSRVADIEALITDGNTADAILELEALRTKVDGCGTAADKGDWVVECDHQVELRRLIDHLVTLLTP